MNAPETIEQHPTLIVPAQSYSRRDLPAAQPSQATSLIQAIATAAADPRTDMDKMERLFAMHQKMVAQQAEAAFNDALARAQAKIEPIANNAFNDHTKSTYAKLAAINKAIVPIYSSEGLSVSFDTETVNEKDPIPQGMLRFIGLLSHSAGHTRRYHIDLWPDDAGIQGTKNKTRVQAAGSTNSYGRRYLVFMMFNISTEDDNDGNDPKTKGNKHEKRPEPKTYPQELFDKNLPTWRKLISDGKKTPDQIIAVVQSKGELTDEQKAAIRAVPAPQAAIDALRAKTKGAEISEAEICKHLKVKSLDGLTVAQVEGALAFINDPVGSQA